MPDDRSSVQIPTAALRFFNIFGPNQALVQSVYRCVAIFASRLLNNRPH